MAAAFDEMKGQDGGVRPAYGELARWLAEVPPDVLDHRRREAELIFRRIGITFAVYGEADAQERLIPFDVIPRIMAGSEWRLLESGLTRRVKALDLFLKDIGAREILRAGVVPDDLVFRNPAFRPEMSGQTVPHDIYVQVAGIDIVRVDAETFYVLEDNARTPSGVSYMLEDREIMMRLFPELFSRHRTAPVENYPDELLATLKSVAPTSAAHEPTVVLLTPGVYMPAIVKFYLDEEPILKNVPTWRCREAVHLSYVLDHLHELVVKEGHGSGGYGMLIGPMSSKLAIEQFRAKLKTSPKNFIAQPTLALSTSPTCVEDGVAPRHVDLRPCCTTCTAGSTAG